jgi:hypothetical protein
VVFVLMLQVPDGPSTAVLGAVTVTVAPPMPNAPAGAPLMAAATSAATNAKAADLALKWRKSDLGVVGMGETLPAGQGQLWNKSLAYCVRPCEGVRKI